MTGTGKPFPTPLLDTLHPEESKQILMQLVRASPEIAEKAEALARELLVGIDIETIAENLADELNIPEIEEVWDTSGRTRDGYIHPDERAYEILEEILDRYISEMNTYLRRGMVDQSREYCAGIILGIRRFCQESNSGLLDELPDFEEEAGYVQVKWEETVADERQIQLLEESLKEIEVE